MCLIYESALNPWTLSGKGLAILRNTRLCDLGVIKNYSELIFKCFCNAGTFEILVLKNIKIIKETPLFVSMASTAVKVVKCDKCGAPMTKRGILQSGNAKYERYVCEKCGNTTLKCIGL